MESLTSILSDQQNSIPYRPRIAKALGSITAAILFQQIIYRWENNDQKPFYKFKEPCEHELYRHNDSWIEEIGFSRKEFDTARKILAEKSKKSSSIDRLKSFNGKMFRYWVDQNRQTWYDAEQDAIEKFLERLYVKSESDFRKSPKGDLHSKVQKGLYEKPESDFRYKESEITTKSIQEITPEIKEDAPNGALHKSKFGEHGNVLLTAEEHQKLIEKHGEPVTTACIEKLDIYKGARGKKYKSDYLAILNWVVDAVKQNGNGHAGNQNSRSNYSSNTGSSKGSIAIASKPSEFTGGRVKL